MKDFPPNDDDSKFIIRVPHLKNYPKFSYIDELIVYFIQYEERIMSLIKTSLLSYQCFLTFNKHHENNDRNDIMFYAKIQNCITLIETIITAGNQFEKQQCLRPRKFLPLLCIIYT